MDTRISDIRVRLKPMDRRLEISGAVRSLLVAAAVVVCSLPSLAQSAAAARVLQMQGRVSIMQDNAEVPLYAGSVVEPKQLIRTGPDGYAKFQLADGSSFEVFQNAQVVFRTNPFSLGDLLDVVIGRVKVFIQHRNGPNPNRVTTQTAVISVRGTVFDVDVEDTDATTLVSVDEGIVGVRHLLLPGREVELQSGQSLRVFKDQPIAKAVDKGGAAQKALRIAAQAVYDIMIMRPATGAGPAGVPGGVGGGPSAGGGQSGDVGKPKTGGSGGPPPAATGAPPPSSGSGPPPPPPAH